MTAAEGFVLGVGAKMFTIAGPVIVYGVTASVVYGLIYYLFSYLPKSKPPVERVVCTAPIRGYYRLNPCSRGIEV